MAEVFISYSRADTPIVQRLQADLVRAGHLVWIDHEQLPPGSPDWEETIRRGIQRCSCLIYAASPSARQSSYVNAELQIGQQYGKKIIPVWINGTQWLDAIPMFLSKIQYCDARGNGYHSALTQLLQAIDNTAPVGKPTQQASTSIAPITRNHTLAFIGYIIGYASAVASFVIVNTSSSDPNAKLVGLAFAAGILTLFGIGGSLFISSSYLGARFNSPLKGKLLRANPWLQIYGAFLTSEYFVLCAYAFTLPSLSTPFLTYLCGGIAIIAFFGFFIRGLYLFAKYGTKAVTTL